MEKKLPIRGEYWYYGRQLHFADGDVGDENHMSIATAHLMGLIHDMNIENLPDLREETDLVSIRETMNNRDNDVYALISKSQKKSGESPGKIKDTYNVLHNKMDIRIYAVKYWEWIRIHGDMVEIPSMSRENVKKAAQAIEAAMGEEGFYDEAEEEEWENHILHICTPKKYGMKTTLAKLTAYEIDDQAPDAFDAAMVEAGRRSTKKLDLEITLPFYKKCGYPK